MQIKIWTLGNRLKSQWKGTRGVGSRAVPKTGSVLLLVDVEEDRAQCSQ